MKSNKFWKQVCQTLNYGLKCIYWESIIWWDLGDILGLFLWRIYRPMWKCRVQVAQSCLTLCDPMDCTVHGILHTRILEWVAFPFSRGSFQPRDRTQVSCIASRLFTSWATREAHVKNNQNNKRHHCVSEHCLTSNIWTPFDVWICSFLVGGNGMRYFLSWARDK